MLKQDFTDWDLIEPVTGFAKVGQFLGLVAIVVAVACFVLFAITVGPKPLP